MKHYEERRGLARTFMPGRVHVPRRRSRKEDLGRPAGISSADKGAPPAKSYKVVSISLYSDQAELVDRATGELLQAGYAKANRSLVVQTAIQRLREDLEGKSAKDILRYFVEQQVRRPLTTVAKHPEQTSKTPSAARRAAGGKDA